MAYTIQQIQELINHQSLDARQLLNLVVDYLQANPGGSAAILKTHAETVALTGNFVAGQQYLITNKGDRGIIVTAATVNKLNKQATRVMLCPAFYGIGANGGNNWIGVWNATKSAAADDLTIWGGLVWKNLTGAIGTATNDTALDATNWVVVPKASFSNSEYIQMVFSCNYDLVNDWIGGQWDTAGNYAGIDYLTEQVEGQWGVNYCDITDWNFASSGKGFSDNKCLGVYNNSNTEDISRNVVKYAIYNNSNTGDIRDNNVGSEISNNSNAGEIRDNMTPVNLANNSNTGKILGNVINGSIENNSNAGVIQFNMNNGDIHANSNAGYIKNNYNNGNIESIGSANANIFNNTNNGNIGVTTTGDITDTIVNK